MPRVFISYDPVDRQHADEAVRTLRSGGVQSGAIDIEPDGAAKIRIAGAIVLIAGEASLADAERLTRVRLAAGFAQPIFVALPDGVAANPQQLSGLYHEQPLYCSDRELGVRVAKALEGIDDASPRIFLSYARTEATQASAMVGLLRQKRLRVFQDIANLYPGVDWLQRLYDFIEESDAVVFAVSPRSVTSDVCKQEVAHALSFGKRILPLVLAELPAGALEEAPAALRQRNFVYAETQEKRAQAAIEVEYWAVLDAAWYRAHAKLVADANAWNGARDDDSRLLRGGVLEAASALLAARPKEAPATPSFVSLFLEESRRAERLARDRLYRGVANGFAVRSAQAISEGRHAHAAKCVAAAAVLGDDIAFTEARAVAAWRLGALSLADAAHVVLNAHEGGVTDLAWSSAGVDLITAGVDGTCCLWDARTGALRHRLVGHVGDVRACKFAPDGRRALSAGVDASARLWDVETGSPLALLEGHVERINAACFSPDGSLIATGSDDGNVSLWRADRGQYIGSLSDHEMAVIDVVFSPDGEILATSSQDGTARSWSVRTQEEIAQPKARSEGLESFIAISVAVSPDGTRVLSGSPTGEVAIWDPRNGQVSLQLKCHGDLVTSASFSPQGDRFVTACWLDRTAKVWDAASGTLIAAMNGHEHVTHALFSPDGRRIVTLGDDAVARIWDAQSGAELARLTGHGDRLTRAAFSPDGKRMVTASVDGTARIWDTASGAAIARCTFSNKAVVAAHLSSSGGRLVTRGADKQTRLWDLSAGQIAAIDSNEDWDTATALSPSGAMLVTAKPSRAPIVSRTSDGERVQLLRGAEKWSDFACFSPDERTVAVGKNQSELVIFDIATGAPRCVIGAYPVHSGAAFSPDGCHIAIGQEDGEVTVWDAQSGAKVQTAGHRATVTKLAYAPSGDRIATAGWDGAARLWDARSGHEIHTFQLLGSDEAVDDVLFMPQLNALATQVRSGRVQIWDVASLDEIGRIDLSDAPSASALAPDGRRLATAGWNGVLQLWDLPTQVELARYAGAWTTVISLDFSEDSQRIVMVAVGSDDSLGMDVWTFDVSRETEAMRFAQGRPSVYVAAALASGVGTLTAREKDDFLFKEVPEDLHAALTVRMSTQDVRTAEILAEILRRTRPEGCYDPPSAWKTV